MYGGGGGDRAEAPLPLPVLGMATASLVAQLVKNPPAMQGRDSGSIPGSGRSAGAQGKKNHMDKSLLSRRALVNLISQEHSWLLQRHLCA